MLPRPITSQYAAQTNTKHFSQYRAADWVVLLQSQLATSGIATSSGLVKLQAPPESEGVTKPGALVVCHAHPSLANRWRQRLSGAVCREI